MATISASYSTGSGPMRNTKLAVTPLSFDGRAPTPDKYSILGVKRVRDAHWSRVKLRVKSVGADQVQQSIVSYLLIDQSGARYPAVSQEPYQPRLSCCGSGYAGDQMSPGDVAVGYVAFQVPNSAHPVKLRMTSTLSDAPPVEWALRSPGPRS